MANATHVGNNNPGSFNYESSMLIFSLKKINKIALKKKSHRGQYSKNNYKMYQKNYFTIFFISICMHDYRYLYTNHFIMESKLTHTYFTSK